MSVYVQFDTLTEQLQKKLIQTLVLIPLENKYGLQDPIDVYDIFILNEITYISVPLFYYLSNIKNKIENISCIEQSYFEHSGFKFEGKLKEKQIEIRDACLSKLNKYKTLLLSLHTGGGKTIIGIYLIYKIKLKCCILVHRKFLIEQWIQRIQQFAPMCKTQVINVKTKIDDTADVYIMNIDSVHKKPKNFFLNIGLLILDEAHLSCGQGRVQSYFNFQPKYLICLTATPFERPDTTDRQLFNLYLGPKSNVHIPMCRTYTAYKFDTKFFPRISYSKGGSLDWSSILEQQADNQKRNQSIINVIKYFKNINFIVLCKRISQTEYLYVKLKELGIDVDVFTGKHKTFNFNTRVLVTSYCKTGCGFDWNVTTPLGIPLNMGLIVASDVEAYFLQYLGRVFRSDVEPIVIDFVDKFKPMENHWHTRQKKYEEVGGIVKNFHKSFLDFTEE